MSDGISTANIDRNYTLVQGKAHGEHSIPHADTKRQDRNRWVVTTTITSATRENSLQSVAVNQAAFYSQLSILVLYKLKDHNLAYKSSFTHFLKE